MEGWKRGECSPLCLGAGNLQLQFFSGGWGKKDFEISLSWSFPINQALAPRANRNIANRTRNQSFNLKDILPCRLWKLLKAADPGNVFPPPIQLFVDRTALLQHRIDGKFIELLPFEFVVSADQQRAATTQTVQLGQRYLCGSLDIGSVARCQCVKVSNAPWTSCSRSILVGSLTQLVCYLGLDYLRDERSLT